MNKVQITAAILTVAAASALSPVFADNNVATGDTKMMSCMKDGKAMDATDAKDCEAKGGKMMEKSS